MQPLRHPQTLGSPPTSPGYPGDPDVHQRLLGCLSTSKRPKNAPDTFFGPLAPEDRNEPRT